MPQRYFKVTIAIVLWIVFTFLNGSQAAIPGNKLVTNKLKGTTVTVNISVTPQQLFFGSTLPGESRPAVLFVSNDSSSTDSLTGTMSISNPDFSLASASTFNLAPGEEKSTLVLFRPTAPGVKNGTLLISHNATNKSSPLNIPLQGIGILNMIIVNQPDSNTIWEMGTINTIRWSYIGNNPVKIELLRNSSFDTTISTSAPSNGLFEWNIPTTLTPDSLYQIKISDTVDSTIMALSSNFKITGALAVHSPTNLEVNAEGNIADLQWIDNADNETSFAVERWDDSSAVWNNVANLPANFQMYSDTALALNRTYKYRIQAKKDTVSSNYTNVMIIRTLQAPTTLTTNPLSPNLINLFWKDNSTGESGFEIERHSLPNGSFFIYYTPPNATSYSDNLFTSDSVYFYEVRAFWSDTTGNVVSYSLYSNQSVVQVTAIDEPMQNSVPQKFTLSQNYPNPFNPTTTISYQLPQAATVKLVIYNTLGQEVRTLVDGQQGTGSYNVLWDGKDKRGNAVASGLYIYRIKAGSFVQTRKMLLMK